MPTASLETRAPFDARYSGAKSSSPPLIVRWITRLALRAQRRSSLNEPSDLARTTDESKYRAWRHRELSGQLCDHFDPERITGRDVMDFGCGTGELSTIIAGYGPRALVAMDKSMPAIRQAKDSSWADNAKTSRQPIVLCNKPHNQIPLGDEGLDLILCFDVLEHIIDVSAIVNEWRRVLRPGGRVWIWWSPWKNPYGHHLESLIPLPWIHLLVPMRTIFSACAELYDHPDYVPRKWDLDPETGEKKPNKWRKNSGFDLFLNRLTRRRFEKTVRDSGMTVARREIHGFGGSRARKATRLLLPTPQLGECFVSYYIYELSNPKTKTTAFPTRS